MSNIKTKQIQQIVQKIVKEFQPEKIILFGSYAWGKPNAEEAIGAATKIKDFVMERF